MKFVFDKIENVVEKREKRCWLQAFSPSCTSFSKVIFVWDDKPRDCMVRDEVVCLIIIQPVFIQHQKLEFH